MFIVFINNNLNATKPPAIKPKELTEKIHFYIDNFKFKKADSLINYYRYTYPTDPTQKLLSADYYWWKIISGENTEESRKIFLRKLDEAEILLLTQNHQKNSDRDLLFHIDINMFRSRLYILEKKYVQALKQWVKSIEYVKLAIARKNNSIELLFSTAIYDYTMGKARQDYRFLSPFIKSYPPSDKDQGILTLKKCSNSLNTVISTKANYALMMLYLEQESKPLQALVFTKKLKNKYPDNLIYQYNNFKILIEKKDEEAFKNQLKHLSKCYNNQEVSQTQINYYKALVRKDLIKFYKEKNN